jgi:hypothetical protein
VVSTILVAALVGGFLATRPASNANPTVRALTNGVGPAAAVADGSSSFVWMERTTPLPTSRCAPDYVCLTATVDVLDWTGALRYQFPPPQVIAGPGPASAADILAISPTGTRALLNNGNVIDESGHVVARLTSLGSLLSAASPAPLAVAWITDGSGLCVLGPSRWLDDPQAAATEIEASGSATDDNLAADITDLTLETVALSGDTRRVADVSLGPFEPGLEQGWSAYAWPGGGSVNASVACDPAMDQAVIAIVAGDPYSTRGISGPNVWDIRLSTGAVVYHQAPTPSATYQGPVGFYAGEGGSLLGEYGTSPSSDCVNSRLTVLRLPSGDAHDHRVAGRWEWFPCP